MGDFLEPLRRNPKALCNALQEWSDFFRRIRPAERDE
jgi:hypothetical protein